MTAESRLAATGAIALHVLLIGALLSYAPTRTAMLAAAPIMVDWIAPPKPVVEPKPTEAPKPKVVPPKPRPVHKAEPPPRPVEPAPVLTAPAEAPSPIVAPAPPPPPPVAVAPAAPPAPVATTAPVFNANYLENPAPPYPALSRRMHEEGRVILRVRVTPDGRAAEVQVRTSSGHARLDDSARQTVSQWKFVPARRGAEPVEAWVLIPINFKVES